MHGAVNFEPFIMADKAMLLMVLAGLAYAPHVVMGDMFGPGPMIGDWGASDSSKANLDPSFMDMLTIFTHLNSVQQQSVLLSVGETLQDAGMDCNIFMGEAACKALPTNSSYLQQCGVRAQQKVDCAFYGEVKDNVYDSPVDNLEEYLAQQKPGIKDMCPQCFQVVQDLWCALAVPKCGTFNGLVQRGMIPILAQAVQAYSSRGATRADAIGKIMVQMLEAQNIGLPCQEMCHAMVNTCGCSRDSDTVGALFAWMGSQPQLKSMAPAPSVRSMFKNVWDVPFCSLFPTRDVPDWSGTCPDSALQPAPQCTQREQWCGATQGPNADAFRYIQVLMLVQLNRAVTGWLTSDNAIIFDIHKNFHTATSDINSKSQAQQRQQQQPGPPVVMQAGVSAGQVVGIVFLCLVGLALTTAGVWSAVLWWRQREQRRQYFELAGQEHFITLQEGMDS